MLKSLYVRNFALIDEAHLELASGLNILTGETGAGKSILVGALGLILGERASTEFVRAGADRAVVEGTFDARGNSWLELRLREEGYETGDELIVRREITARGTSRAFVNDSPAQLSLVREIGDHLVDLHGQHEHQMLLRPETHIGFLDNAAGLVEDVARYAAAFSDATRLFDELAELRRRETQLREKQEFYRFQLAEIDAIGPHPNEDTELQQELKILENGEKLMALVSEAGGLLSEGEANAYERLTQARNCLDQLSGIDEAFNEYRAECASALVAVGEISKFIAHYSDRIEFAPERIEEIRERLFALSGLRKKFGGSLEAVIDYRERIASEIELAGNFDETIAELTRALEAARLCAGELAADLSKRRRLAARKIEKGVEEMLRKLGIETSRFVIEIGVAGCSASDRAAVAAGGGFSAATASGVDRVEFFISTNAGEEPRPLARVASGGEISRVMLALKSILASGGRLPVLVFDEIDTGISGRIASKVGTAMQRLAANHQIVAITHLPQIAAMSSHHYVVSKQELDGRTVTRVNALDEEEHTREVAKLMSGEKVTESSLRMARELIGG